MACRLGMLMCLLVLPGCAIGALVGGMAQNAEYQKLLDVPPEYDGLEGHTVAVVVDSGLATLYEYPQLAREISAAVALRIQRDVPNVRVLSPDLVLAWQFNTSQWSAMPLGDLAAALEVERVVYIELFEFRLNPPGDSWQWDGVCAANIGVIEADGFDPDNFAATMNLTTTYPDVLGFTRDEATKQQIYMGLVGKFIRSTAWLFHQHLEPKYPDKYQGVPPS